MTPLPTAFAIQLEKILQKLKVQCHAPGPKKPSLTQQDFGKAK